MRGSDDPFKIRLMPIEINSYFKHITIILAHRLLSKILRFSDLSNDLRDLWHDVTMLRFYLRLFALLTVACWHKN